MTAHPVDGTDAIAERPMRPNKSRAAFRTISEVADELDVAQHVLRFWESKFPQVRPLKRGGGRRYYRPEDVGLLREIRTLLYDEGYTIKGAEKLLRQRRSRPAQDRQAAVAKPEPLKTGTTEQAKSDEVKPESELLASISEQAKPDGRALTHIRDQLVALKAKLDALTNEA